MKDLSEELEVGFATEVLSKNGYSVIYKNGKAQVVEDEEKRNDTK